MFTSSRKNGRFELAKITPAITPCNDLEPTAFSEAKFTKPYVGETPHEFNGKLFALVKRVDR